MSTLSQFFGSGTSTSAIKSIQRGEQLFSLTSTPQRIPISPVNLEKSVLITSHKPAVGTDSGNFYNVSVVFGVGAYLRANTANPANTEIMYRSISGSISSSDTGILYWQVVEYN